MDEKNPKLELMDVLEMKYVLRIIQYVKDRPGVNKSEVIEHLGGNDRTIGLRIRDLIDVEVLDFNDEKRKHNSIKLYLTPKGQELSVTVDNLLKQVERF